MKQEQVPYFVYMENTIIFDNGNRHHYISAFAETSAVSKAKAIENVIWRDKEQYKRGYPRRFWKDDDTRAQVGNRTTEIKVLKSSKEARKEDYKELKWAQDHYTVLKERWEEVSILDYIKELENKQ